MDSNQNDDMTILSPNEPRSDGGFNSDQGQLVDVPSFEPAPQYETPVTHGEVVTPGGPPKKSNRTVWIIVAIVLAVICCCCIIVVVGANRMMQDQNLEDWQDLLDQFSLLIQLAPAYI
jgi:hypothetical protein